MASRTKQKFPVIPTHGASFLREWHFLASTAAFPSVDNSSDLRSSPYIDLSYATSVCVLDVEVRATLHEHIDSLRVSRHYSPEHRSHAVDVGVIHICAVLDQYTSKIRVIFRHLCGMAQSRVPAYILDVWWTAVFKQELES